MSIIMNWMCKHFVPWLWYSSFGSVKEEALGP